MGRDYQYFSLGDVGLESSETLHEAKLTFQTYGKLNSSGNNVVVLPTFYTGSHRRNRGFFGPGRAIDPARHFIVSINLFGNGLSTSPSNANPINRGANFPYISFADNINCQYRLLTEHLGVQKIALVTGWSMAGCQAYHWARMYPDMVKAILPFCASARTSPHNWVFLEGVKAALQADCKFNNGNYRRPPQVGLKAFARVYAGWAYSQTFYRDGWYRKLGYNSPQELLRAWETDHLTWDANDLLAMLCTWQHGDISNSCTDKLGDNQLTTHSPDANFVAALNAIQAKTIIIACDNDLYFPPQDNELEIAHISDAQLRIYQSAFGHCVASPGCDNQFQLFLDDAIHELLAF